MIRFTMTETQYKTLRTIYQISVEGRKEICLLGVVEQDPKDRRNFILKELMMPKQRVTGASTDIDPEWLVQLAMKGQRFNFWFHTHPDINSSFSPTDDNTIDKLSAKCDYFISMVLADSYDIYIRMDISKPVSITTNISLQIIEEPTSDLYKKLKEDVKKNVKFDNIFNKFTMKNYLTSEDTSFQLMHRYPHEMDTVEVSQSNAGYRPYRREHKDGTVEYGSLTETAFDPNHRDEPSEHFFGGKRTKRR